MVNVVRRRHKEGRERPQLNILRLHPWILVSALMYDGPFGITEPLHTSPSSFASITSSLRTLFYEHYWSRPPERYPCATNRPGKMEEGIRLLSIQFVPFHHTWTLPMAGVPPWYSYFMYQYLVENSGCHLYCPLWYTTDDSTCTTIFLCQRWSYNFLNVLLVRTDVRKYEKSHKKSYSCVLMVIMDFQ